MTLTIAQRSRPCAGESVNGDAIVVRRDGAATLVAVIDGLGHGSEAALASRRAADHLMDAVLGGSAAAVVVQLHEVLAGTRGAAALVCLFAESKVRVCGVGNVELRSLVGSLAVPLNPGILGHHMRRRAEVEAALAPGERIVVFSDGISARFDLHEHRARSPEDACTEILARHGRHHDDASVVVIDVGGPR